MVMGCTVSELLQRISSTELSEWVAFDQIEPIGEVRGDVRAGIIASTYASGTMKKKGGGKWSPLDFMPFADKPKENPVARFKAQMAHLVVNKNGDTK